MERVPQEIYLYIQPVIYGELRTIGELTNDHVNTAPGEIQAEINQDDVKHLLRQALTAGRTWLANRKSASELEWLFGGRALVQCWRQLINFCPAFLGSLHDFPKMPIM